MIGVFLTAVNSDIREALAVGHVCQNDRLRITVCRVHRRTGASISGYNSADQYPSLPSSRVIYLQTYRMADAALYPLLSCALNFSSTSLNLCLAQHRGNTELVCRHARHCYSPVFNAYTVWQNFRLSVLGADYFQMYRMTCRADRASQIYT
jgi:hypothetical protein